MQPLPVRSTNDPSQPPAPPAWRPRVIHTPQQVAQPQQLARAEQSRVMRSSVHWIARNRGFIARSLLRLSFSALALYTLALPFGLLVLGVMLASQFLVDEPAPPPSRPVLRAV